MLFDGSQPQYFISTEVDRNNPWQNVSSGTHMVHWQRHMPSGKNKLERYFQISKHHFISRSEYYHNVALRSFRVTHPHQ